MGQSLVGGTPMIPAGMSASAALRVDALISTVHPRVKADLVSRAAEFREMNGYEAPYWVLVELAREAVGAQKESLRPALALP